MFVQDHQEKYSEIVIDDLTWKTLITNSLRLFHGIRGEACHFDILQKNSNKPQIKVIIRTQVEDKNIFITSLMNYTFSLSSHLGSEYHTNGYMKVNSQGDFLGVVADNSFILLELAV